MLAAGDTFRAAASEQLEIWADRAGVPIVSAGEGADPAAVIFDTVSLPPHAVMTWSLPTPQAVCTTRQT